MMRLSHAVAIATFGAASTLAGCGADGTSQGANAGAPQKVAMPQSVVAAPMTDSEEAAAGNKKMDAIPDSILALIMPGDVLLAYRTMSLTKDGNNGAVIIVRRPVRDDYADYDKNPCDLLILQDSGDRFEVTGKSSKAVDCTYNNFARKRASKSDDLNDTLELKPSEVIVHNENERGGSSTYSFKHSSERTAWYLASVTMTFARSNESTQEMEVFRQAASFPDDIGWIQMSSFDPKNEKIQQILLQNESMIE